MNELITCDVCGADVGKAYVEDNDNGWLAWWMNQETKSIDAIHVVCHGPMVRDRDSDGDMTGRCLYYIERKMHERGLQQLDHHLSFFAGDAAIYRLWELRSTYPKWEKKTDQRLCQIFMRLQKLPTWIGRVEGRKRAAKTDHRKEVARIAADLGGVDELLNVIATEFDLGDEP